MSRASEWARTHRTPDAPPPSRVVVEKDKYGNYQVKKGYTTGQGGYSESGEYIPPRNIKDTYEYLQQEATKRDDNAYKEALKLRAAVQRKLFRQLGYQIKTDPQGNVTTVFAPRKITPREVHTRQGLRITPGSKLASELLAFETPESAGLRHISINKLATDPSLRGSVYRAQQRFDAPFARRQEIAGDVYTNLRAKWKRGNRLTAKERLALGVAATSMVGLWATEGFTAPIVHPVQTIKGIGSSVIHPKRALRLMYEDFVNNPVKSVTRAAGTYGALAIAGRVGGTFVPKRIKTSIRLAEEKAIGAVKNSVKNIYQRAKELPSTTATKRIIAATKKAMRKIEGETFKQKIHRAIKETVASVKKYRYEKRVPKIARRELAYELARKQISLKKAITKAIKEKNRPAYRILKDDLIKTRQKFNKQKLNAAERLQIKMQMAREKFSSTAFAKKLYSAAKKGRTAILSSMKTTLKSGRDYGMRVYFKPSVARKITFMTKKLKVALQNAGIIVRFTSMSAKRVLLSKLAPIKVLSNRITKALKMSGYKITPKITRLMEKMVSYGQRARIKISFMKSYTIEKIGAPRRYMKTFKTRISQKIYKKLQPTQYKLIRLNKKLRYTGFKIRYSIKDVPAILSKFKLRQLTRFNTLLNRIILKIRIGKGKLSKPVRKALNKLEILSKKLPFKIEIVKLKDIKWTIRKRKKYMQKYNNMLWAKKILDGKIKLTRYTPKEVRRIVRKRLKQGGEFIRRDEPIIRRQGTQPGGIYDLALKNFRENIIKNAERNTRLVNTAINNAQKFYGIKGKPITISRTINSNGRLFVKQIVKSSNTKSKPAIKKALKTGEEIIKIDQRLALKLINMAKNKSKLRSLAGAMSLSVISMGSTYNNMLSRLKKNRLIGKISPIITPKSIQKAKQIPIIKQDTISKSAQIPITIPAVRVDTLSKTQQIQLIESIVLQVFGASAILRSTGQKVHIPQSKFRGGAYRLRKWIWNKLQHKKYVYTPDIYSIIFGVKAKPRERIILLKPGRFFTGFERRGIV